MTKALQTFSILFSVVGFYFLLRRLDFAYQVIPITAAGSEGGLIEIAIDTVLGIGAALIAIILAFLNLLHSNSNKTPAPTKTPKLLLAWCCLLMVGFAGFFFL
jgi:mannose/fructose/N-acetylgalactosamine-specific phosphotransferase system component IIC